MPFSQTIDNCNAKNNWHVDRGMGHDRGSTLDYYPLATGGHLETICNAKRILRLNLDTCVRVRTGFISANNMFSAGGGDYFGIHPEVKWDRDWYLNVQFAPHNYLLDPYGLAYDLGATANRWFHIYLGGAIISFAWHSTHRAVDMITTSKGWWMSLAVDGSIVDTQSQMSTNDAGFVSDSINITKTGDTVTVTVTTKLGTVTLSTSVSGVTGLTGIEFVEALMEESQAPLYHATTTMYLTDAIDYSYMRTEYTVPIPIYGAGYVDVQIDSTQDMYFSLGLGFTPGFWNEYVYDVPCLAAGGYKTVSINIMNIPPALKASGLRTIAFNWLHDYPQYGYPWYDGDHTFYVRNISAWGGNGDGGAIIL